jgi:glycosyltransferase involved in cell wall biosynthesis
MIPIKYISAHCNPSGYGSAARNFITALYVGGVNVTLETVSQMTENADYGMTGSICRNLERRDIPYKIIITHLTPDLIPAYKEPGKYQISHLAWETDKLPKEWIDPLGQCDEIWCMSQPQADMVAKCGISTPTYCFPQPIDVTLSQENIQPYKMQYSSNFVFYSIFQWIPRKNPKTLLRAYWQEFEGNNDVALLLKVYKTTYVEQQYNAIKAEIQVWKQELGLKQYPKVLLLHKIMTDQQMIRLHKTGHCYVNSSSGEGWLRPIEESMIVGNPVISADNGGITDYMSDYYKVLSHEKNAEFVPTIPWYTQNMRWKEIDEADLRRKMRSAYESPQKTLSHKAQKFVVDHFSFQEVGRQMRQRLEKISVSI